MKKKILHFFKLFYGYKLMPRREKGLVAGRTHVPVAGKGSISLLNRYTTNDILHVLNFFLNLLSLVGLKKI